MYNHLYMLTVLVNKAIFNWSGIKGDVKNGSLWKWRNLSELLWWMVEWLKGIYDTLFPIIFYFSLLYSFSLGIETISCRLLPRMARMEMDWNLKKLALLFQVLMLCLQKPPTKLLWLVGISLMKFVWYLLHVSTGAFLDHKKQYRADISPLARALTVISNRHGSCSWTLTLPMAHKILFLIIEAMWFMNSIDVAQGSIQVVLMYLTAASLFELS